MDYRMKRYVKQFRMLNNVEIRLEKKKELMLRNILHQVTGFTYKNIVI